MLTLITEHLKSAGSLGGYDNLNDYLEHWLYEIWAGSSRHTNWARRSSFGFFCFDIASLGDLS